MLGARTSSSALSAKREKGFSACGATADEDVRAPSNAFSQFQTIQQKESLDSHRGSHQIQP